MCNCVVKFVCILSLRNRNRIYNHINILLDEFAPKK